MCVSLLSVQAAKITPTPFPEWETFLETVNYVRITACAKMVANGMSSMRGICILAHSSTHGCAKFCAEIFAGIFTVECVLKIFALRTNYWGSALRVKTICAKKACKFACSGDRWNCFDFTCVATDLVSLFACVKLPQVSPPPPPHSTTNLLFRLPRLWALSSAEPPMWTAHLSAEQNRGKGHPSQKSLSTLELVVPFGFQCSQKSGKIVTNLAPERLSLRS